VASRFVRCQPSVGWQTDRAWTIGSHSPGPLFLWSRAVPRARCRREREEPGLGMQAASVSEKSGEGTSGRMPGERDALCTRSHQGMPCGSDSEAGGLPAPPRVSKELVSWKGVERCHPISSARPPRPRHLLRHVRHRGMVACAASAWLSFEREKEAV